MESPVMASNTSHPYRIHYLKVTFLNDLVSRSRRPLEDTEEGSQPSSKRQCSSSPHLSSPSNGLAPSQVHLLADNEYCDDNDMNDSLLEPSDGESLDSPTGLSPEDENLLLEDDPETSSCVEESGLNALVQSSRLLEEGKKGPHTQPPHPAGPSACKENFVCLKSENDLSKGSQNQAGLDLASKHPLLPETAPVNLEKGNGVPGVREEASAQTGRETNAGGERPSVGQASVDQKTGGENASNLLGYTGGELDSADLQRQAAPSSSSSVGDQRENHAQDLLTREPKRPRRICIQEADLESSKEKYINAVLNHASHRAPVIGEVNEMLALMQRVASEYREYGSQHTTDLTVRNYAQRSRSTTQTFSLSQWVDRNGRSVRRFESIPKGFQRSPIPS